MDKDRTQTSTLLPSLFEPIEEAGRLCVFHVGPALQDTVSFLSAWRCRLHVVDVFSELPLPPAEEREAGSLQALFEDMLALPGDTRFDVCLFWDLFNFLDREAIGALMAVLRPRLGDGCRAHAFSVHNARSAPGLHLYGISDADTLRLKPRDSLPPGYAPHRQAELQSALGSLRIERSLLLPDSRLELLLHHRPAGHPLAAPQAG